MKPSTDACPCDETLASFLDETVGSHEFDDHILHCQTCRSRLDQLSGSELLVSYRPQALSYSFLEKPLRGGDLGSIGEMHIEKEIGRGAMGVVFRAHDQTLNRAIAIKVLTGEANQRSTGRFDRESRAAAGLRHDHLVPVHSVGQTIDGRPYLVMPLVQGQSLKERLADGPLDPQEAATFIGQIAQGLATVHDHDLVHRDVKSANIMLDAEDGRAKLTDFGLARAEVDATLTQANAICGTPEYMSPEQATGSTDAQPASDIYSLGVTLYECLTGTTPFRGSPIQILDQHRQAEPVAPSRLNAQTPRDLETICLKALEKEPGERYGTAMVLADDLQRFVDGRAISARPIGPLGKAWRWSLRNRALATVSSLGLLVLLAGSIVSTLLWINSAQNAALAEKRNESLLASEKTLRGNLANLSESIRESQWDSFHDQEKFLQMPTSIRNTLLISMRQSWELLFKTATSDPTQLRRIVDEVVEASDFALCQGMELRAAELTKLNRQVVTRLLELELPASAVDWLRAAKVHNQFADARQSRVTLDGKPLRDAAKASLSDAKRRQSCAGTSLHYRSQYLARRS